jgi:hypothetical protein
MFENMTEKEAVELIARNVYVEMCLGRTLGFLDEATEIEKSIEVAKKIVAESKKQCAEINASVR